MDVAQTAVAMLLSDSRFPAGTHAHSALHAARTPSHVLREQARRLGAQLIRSADEVWPGSAIGACRVADLELPRAWVMTRVGPIMTTAPPPDVSHTARVRNRAVSYSMPKLDRCLVGLAERSCRDAASLNP